MKQIVLSLFAAATLFAGSASQTFTGIISDSMCGANHAMMHVTPDSKCVRDCVKAHAKYVLMAGQTAYQLSDQQTPEKFAAQRVKVTGILKGALIEVQAIQVVK
ncbi:MAG TPA: hypothetical protein VGS58_00040 [Candidatus Sulfopaludibacter sp.]|nr:hypothetical protein [Candidatus Sulfopaludibacter sp.]